MVQQSFTDMKYEKHKRVIRREAFVQALGFVIPCNEWIALFARAMSEKNVADN
jgi:hypothetical protein